MLGAPSEVDDKQLRELNIQLTLAARERLREEQQGQSDLREASGSDR